MTTALEFAAKCQAAAAFSPEIAREATAAAALRTKQVILAQSPSRLRGVGKKGANIGVRYTVSASPEGAAALVFATGPFQLIERDTRAHRIPKGGGRKRRYAVIPGVGVRAWANHPGTKGKHPFEKGVVEAHPLNTIKYFETLHSRLASIF